ncbi:MAG: FHA domain-containing protein [Anaerolineae bacterium]|nr:FHA domain-containing protein [Anaerolineae bacterium]
METGVCPYCGSIIPKRALSCRMCKRLFVQLDVTETTDAQGKTRKVVAFPKEKITPRAQLDDENEDSTSDSTKISPLLLEPLKVHEIALFIESQPIPLIVAVAPLAILGRHGQHESNQPQVDLVPFGAFEKGVSRFHACLRREHSAFEIEDLASSNGTWLNDRRLMPSQPTALRAGDTIRLGQLKMQVMFIDAPSDSDQGKNASSEA